MRVRNYIGAGFCRKESRRACPSSLTAPHAHPPTLDAPMSPELATSLPTQPEAPAIPEHMVVLLLEAGQRFVVKLQEVVALDDPRPRAHFSKKILAILEELDRRLNHEQGGELVDNLTRMHAWWRKEVLQACEAGDLERLGRVHAQMGEIRYAWEQVLFRGTGMTGNASF